MPKTIDLLLPKDGDGRVIPVVPAVQALATTLVTGLSSAQDVSLNASTLFVEVNAITQAVYMKYGGTAGTADYDEFIAADSIRHYVVPDGVSVLSFIEKSASAEVVLIEK